MWSVFGEQATAHQAEEGGETNHPSSGLSRDPKRAGDVLAVRTTKQADPRANRSAEEKQPDRTGAGARRPQSPRAARNRAQNSDGYSSRAGDVRLDLSRATAYYIRCTG